MKLDLSKSLFLEVKLWVDPFESNNSNDYIKKKSCIYENATLKRKNLTMPNLGLRA